MSDFKLKDFSNTTTMPVDDVIIQPELPADTASNIPDEIKQPDVPAPAAEKPEEETIKPEQTVEQPENKTPETPKTKPEKQVIKINAKPEKTETPAEQIPTAQEADTVHSELNDEAVLKFLSEKLGRNFDSLDEFKPVENILDSNPELKEIWNWSQKTNRPIEDWIKYRKDYDSMSDVEIAREFLQNKYSGLTESELQLEMDGFLPDEDDTEIEAAKKTLALKKFAIEGRRELNAIKNQFNTPLPKTANLTDEQKQAVDFYEQAKKQNQVNQIAQQQYEKSILDTVNQMDDLSLELSDELSIDYSLTEDDKKTLPTLIKTMPHWYNPDGSTNHKAVVQDALIIKNFNNIVKIAFEQGISQGKHELGKDVKNITLADRPNMQSGREPNSSDIRIEGAEDMIPGKSKLVFKHY